MAKNPIPLAPDLRPDRRRSRLLPIAAIFVLVPLVAPLFLEAVCSAMPSGARSWARPSWCGHRSWTRFASGSKTSGRISGSGSLPSFQRVPWNPKVVLPLIAVVMAIAMLMLRL